MKRGLVWFRNDLRLRHNATLQQALRECDEIVPLYVFDSRHYENTTLGFPKIGAHRAQFIHESVANLRQNIKDRSGALVVQLGHTEEVVRQLHSFYQFDAIYTTAEVTREEKQMERAVENLGLDLQRVWNSTLYHFDDLPMPVEEVPQVYTAFRKKVEKQATIRSEIPTPDIIPVPQNIEEKPLPTLEDLGLSAPEKDGRAVLHFKGGEDEAWLRLEHYFWEGDHLQQYKKTRNGLLGADFSSKFSAWLAQGCIAPVSIYRQVKEYEQQRVKNSSTYWLIFELIWRDFFRFIALKEGNAFFKVPQDFEPKVHPDFEKWRVGATGQDFVDANMQELMHSGYMSNRGRQNVASYLVKDMGQSWYAGALWFESQLIDYDVCSNYGNWAYVAGVGNDPRENRYFNVAGQAERYDGNGEYRGYWLIR